MQIQISVQMGNSCNRMFLLSETFCSSAEGDSTQSPSKFYNYFNYTEATEISLISGGHSSLFLPTVVFQSAPYCLLLAKVVITSIHTDRKTI